MNKKINWGIIGTGNIAHQFAEGLSILPDVNIAGVASRSEERAKEFADCFNIQHSYSSYQELVLEQGIDVIYIATPHTYHKDNTIMCLKAGKPVLCEKPFAVNLTEAEEMVSLARSKNIFLMEAMWTRYFPVMEKVREWLAEGLIGEVKWLEADFGINKPVKPSGRLYNLELGGGALLDVGIYPVSLASMVFGRQPSSIKAAAEIGETGVDEQTAVIFKYKQGKMAQLSCAIRTKTREEACITGTRGYIVIPEFHSPSSARVYREGKVIKEFEQPLEGNGLNYEAAEVNKYLRSGKKESAVMPLKESLNVMETLDKIRDKINLRYPADK
ncbi:Gfo/Idh/MocA family oxidoreductase [Halocella sp. SP3-1]|uniref:Gfo/Idh/MocA family protein n=1 Tax=Halocella sp. SP3-1 TaxID=2382161 RepID=UPI000F74FE52|nr:Gfo/Idh/MocA family oxidoreductase [Halocella sp. SP3-1]AZO95832.1 gfo/Idh/MocA family oxidoreductase [Halocella sp. SP3-1]